MKKVFLFISVLILSLFLCVSDVFANDVENKLNNNFSKESNLNNSNNKDNKKDVNPNASNEDIFGDEQAFPFIAGLGKNAAH